MTNVRAGGGKEDQPISRRRALSIVAGGAVALLAGKHVGATDDPHVWEGTALGAPAHLILYGVGRAESRAAVGACLDEVERLEREFSLYRPDSALSRLNRQGHLDAPSLDLFRLLALSVRLGQLTDGAFDVTVQPLWQAYAGYFASEAASTAGPSEAVVDAARARVDFRRLHISRERIALAAGMAVTLNGIAQGYITDRVAALLHARGWSRVLVDMGEIRTLGQPADSATWSIGIAVPPGIDRPPVRLAVADGAIATSAGYATAFEPTARSHHLFSPQTGRSAGSFAAVTVTAPRATLADGLSTAFYVMPPNWIASVLGRFPSAAVYLTEASGEVRRVSA